MANEVSDILTKTCFECVHCTLTTLRKGYGIGIPVKEIGCRKGHRQLREEDLALCHVYSDADLELYHEHLYLHCPHYSPEDDPEGSYVKMTRDGWSGGEGKGEAMLWHVDCPDWERQGPNPI